MSEQDTREQLEAELRDELRLVFGGNGGQRYASYKFVQSLLDRQAEITRRETRQSWQDAPNILDRENLRTIDRLTADAHRWADAANEQRLVAMEQADKVCELTAERDELREALDACGTGTMYELWRKDHAQLEAIRAALHDKPGT